MSDYYRRYQQGLYQEVYEELVDLGEAVFDEPIYQDALAVARAMLKRVRYNFEEILIPRLKQLEYRFGEGLWGDSDETTDEEVLLKSQQEWPIFQSALPDAAEQIAALEQLVGPIPLTLKAWYEEMQTVNLIGAFPRPQPEFDVWGGYTLKRGYDLNPFYIYPPDATRHFIELESENGAEEPAIALSMDQDTKYGNQGGWDYAILEPFKVFDGIISLEENDTMQFVHYLQKCLRWGGCPGLEKLWGRERCPLTQEELHFLTSDLLPF